jgi:hypothetical protein
VERAPAALAGPTAGTRQEKLFDPTRTEPSPQPSLVMQPLPGMVEGYTR